jgi:nonsense-mediated mRNA decay protein 3
MSEEFCVVCGRTGVPTVDGLCTECFAQRTPLVRVEGRPIVVMCPTCGARRVGQEWERRGAPTLLGPDDLMPLLSVHPEVGVRKVHWSEGGPTALVRAIEADVDCSIRGERRRETVTFDVKVEHHTCPDCSRRSGHYYTAVLQLRGPEESRETPRALRQRLDDQWEALMPEARVSWRQAISWKEELPEGWDFYFTDTLAARSIAKLGKERLDGELKESATLWGRRHGRDVYRVTFCLRLPAPPGGDSPSEAPPLERQS